MTVIWILFRAIKKKVIVKQKVVVNTQKQLNLKLIMMKTAA